MAPNPRILRFAQTRKKSAFVLVQAASTGRHPLDLKLIGTDGFSPFVTTLQQNRVLSLKHSCPDEEWEEILAALLSQKTPDGIQATARVEEGRDADDPPSHLTIEVRRSVQGITKHMGDITLRYKPEEPIDVVDWCNTSVQAYEEATKALEKEGERIAKLENEVDDLQTQLNELIEAKKADEAGLMEKFRDLLNEKKVKIREQQRLLATTSHRAPPTAEGTPEAAVPTSPKVKKEPKESQARAPGPSRRRKRKQPSPPPPEEDSDGSGFEKMDTDEPSNVRPARDSEDDRTTDAASDDDATASEDDEDEAPPPARPNTRKKAAAKKSEGTSSRATTRASKAEAGGKAADDAPPPKRELPFSIGKKGGGSKAKAVQEPEGSETESDDEL
ncbi:hypothetical protein jhhlp_004329 [Lomentospora prolificans]|uniref:XRCC4 coiled-coil domain-containing protein n=1 Tax=Lomentospora prolificans TaxID=41688 RepID=A0A2N3NB94_9PEZI|nr:hypothetical protein jhhlp_004329 [Lomentospora prolificans]